MEKYEGLKMEIIVFDDEDTITCSGDGPETPWVKD